MIPILYDSNETEFTSNGLGRLRDAISVKVTEERNSVYECDFQYPVGGHNYDLIRLGRIIAVEHDDTNDIQPFDIVSSTEPLDGIVTFHAVHISYRLTKAVARGTNINSLADAFAMLQDAQPQQEFTYWTDKASTGFLPSADGTPRSVRQFLGGVEGSILDTYGGEYEFDKFTVKLWNARGTERDFSIRYGINLVDFNKDTDYSESYNACIPFWKSENALVVGDMITSDNSYTGRTDCVPLDLSDKFETQPTKAQVEEKAQTILNSNQPYLPSQNIKVDFVRLQDSEEYSALANLYKCSLCDYVKVEFPRYNMSGRFKIVKTVYDVLLERFESMELGNLSTTLSEALGISNGNMVASRDSAGTNYIRYDNGLQICWINSNVSMAINNKYSTSPLYTGTYEWVFPVEFISAPSVTVGAVKWGTGASWGSANSATTTSVMIRGTDYFSRASNTTHIEAMAIGWWK